MLSYIESLDELRIALVRSKLSLPVFLIVTDKEYDDILEEFRKYHGLPNYIVLENSIIFGGTIEISSPSRVVRKENE